MKKLWILTAAAALSAATAAPQFARADRPAYERYDRYDRYPHYRDFDEDIDMRDVPRDVRETLNRERRGRRVESVQYVHRDGKFFYRFRIDDPHPRDRDLSIRIAPDGRVLSVEEAERYDHRYRR